MSEEINIKNKPASHPFGGVIHRPQNQGDLESLEKKERSSNFEFLRIVCMLLIICGHIVMVHGYEEVGDSSWMIRQIFRPFTTVAVNVFVLISGYFGIKMNIKKLWKLNWMVTFYCVVFLLMGYALGFHGFEARRDWMQLLPVVTKQYWFITVYFALCLVSPFLNKLVDVLDKEMYKKLLLTCFALFVLLPTFAVILNFKTITLDSGYGLINFMFLYMLGRYIRLHFTPTWNRYKYLLAYFCSMSVMAAFQILYSKLLGFDFDALISYDTLFTFTGAVCLFLYFQQLRFTSKIINTLAAPCLAVYVIHINPIIFRPLFEDVLNVKGYNGVSYIGCLILLPFVVYLACAGIEMVRAKVTEKVKLR